MEIIYQLTEQDFIEAHKVHRDRSGIRKWSMRAFFGIFGLLTVVLLLGLAVKPSMQAAKNDTPFFVVVVVWLAILLWLPRWTMRRQFRKQPSAQGPITLTINSSGTRRRWSGGSSEVEWKNYIRFTEGKNQILLYTSPACFNIIPKRSIGEAELNNLREFLQQHVLVK